MPRDMEGTTQEERPGSGSTRQVAAETMRPHGQCLHRGSGKVHTAKVPADFIGVFEGHKVTVRGGSEVIQAGCPQPVCGMLRHQENMKF